MDVLLSTLIGLGGGLAMTILMPDIRADGASASARRRFLLIGAGGIGGIVVGYGATLLSPALRGDALAASVAALAGALGLSWLTGAVLSRRRAGDDDGAFDANRPASQAPDMPAHDAARRALVEHLLDDAAAHETGYYAEAASDLAVDRDISDPRVTTQFTYLTPEVHVLSAAGASAVPGTR